METDQKICLKVDFATKNYELAVAKKAEHINFNLRLMNDYRHRVAIERLAGSDRNQLICTYGRWIMLFNLVESSRYAERSAMQFFDIYSNINRIDWLIEEPDEIMDDIVRAIRDYQQVFDPKKHDFVRLVCKLPN